MAQDEGKGRVALVTGGASGIGVATAGMRPARPAATREPG